MKEVERVVQDPVYWVRREAAFALGALAKVVPEEIVTCSFVGTILLMSRRSDDIYSSLYSIPCDATLSGMYDILHCSLYLPFCRAFLQRGDAP